MPKSTIAKIIKPIPTMISNTDQKTEISTGFVTAIKLITPIPKITIPINSSDTTASILVIILEAII